MKSVVSVCLLLLGAALIRADAPTLPEARLRWLHGNYEEAKAQYEELAKDAKLKVPATIGLSLALQSTGAYDKALAAVEDALKDHADDPALNARHAELLYLRGRWDDALKAAETAVRENTD